MLKRTEHLRHIIIMCLCILLLSSSGVFAGVSDTSGNWIDQYDDFETYIPTGYNSSAKEIVLNNVKDLVWLSYLTSQDSYSGIDESYTIKLGADIDLAGHYWTGCFTTLRYPFEGTFDGCGHTIRNMTVEIQKSGLIGIMEDAVIKNIILETVNINSGASGALVYMMRGRSRIYNCGVSGIVTNNSAPFAYTSNSASNGYAEGIIYNCWANIDSRGSNSYGINYRWENTAINSICAM